MDRREKDGLLDALLVGWWVDRDTKMDGWMDGYIYIYKDGWLDGQRKKPWMVAWIETWMVRKNGWMDC